MQPQKEHKRKYAAAVGGVFIILAIIGAINVVILCVNLTMDLLDNQRQKIELEEFLTPVVMFDPAPFSNATEIENGRALLYSMWRVLSDETQEFERSKENFTLLVPFSALDVSAHDLFGEGIELKHESFSYIDSTYYYNEEKKAYEVATAGYLYINRPQVNSITKNADNTYDVEVEYIPPENAWDVIYKANKTEREQQQNKEQAEERVKKVIYVVSEDGGNWKLLAVKPHSEGVYQGEAITGTTETAKGDEQQPNNTEKLPDDVTLEKTEDDTTTVTPGETTEGTLTEGTFTENPTEPSDDSTENPTA